MKNYLERVKIFEICANVNLNKVILSTFICLLLDETVPPSLLLFPLFTSILPSTTAPPSLHVFHSSNHNSATIAPFLLSQCNCAANRFFSSALLLSSILFWVWKWSYDIYCGESRGKIIYQRGRSTISCKFNAFVKSCCN